MLFAKPKGFGDQQDILWMLGGGVLSALFFLSLLAHPMAIVLMGFSPLPLYFLAYKGHTTHAKGALGVALVVLGVFMGIGSALSYGVIFGGPFWVFLTLMPKGKGKTIDLAMFLGAQTAYFSVLSLGLMALMSQFFSRDMGHMLHEMTEGFPELKQALQGADVSMIQTLLGYVPGITCVWGALMTLINASMGYSLVARTSKPIVTLSSLDTLKLPFGVWIALAGFGVLAVVFSQTLLGCTAVNVILVLMIVFLVEGLSVLKVALSKQKNGETLFLVLAGLGFIFNVLLLGVVIVGVLEPWLRLRRKLCDHRRDQ